ncbi:MAG: hypothetical protein EAY65_07365 [Alphaproteobacteria bacterium]|nr:MAG: hypothetical protein EAY65_07365 [Alphaproteobacteria bacterium]
MQPEHIPQNRAYIPATIAVGQTRTPAINLHGVSLCGVIIPSTYDGASLSLEMSSAIDGTYVAVGNGAGGVFSLNVAPNRYEPIIELPIIAGIMYVRLVASTAQTTTDSVLQLVVRPI